MYYAKSTTCEMWCRENVQHEMRVTWKVQCEKCEVWGKTVKKRSTVERVRQGTGKKWGSKPEKV